MTFPSGQFAASTTTRQHRLRFEAPKGPVPASRVQALLNAAGQRIVFQARDYCADVLDTFCTFDDSRISDEIRGIWDLLWPRCGRAELGLDRWDPLASRCSTLPEMYDCSIVVTTQCQSSLGSALPAQLREAVGQTMTLAAQMPRCRIGEPSKETDPENPEDWWIAVPVTCAGDESEILAAYNALVSRFVRTVQPPERDRIRIDLQIEE